TILAHLMGYIPFGNVATRINFMSALSQIGAGLMMFLLFRRWMRNIWVAWLVVGIFSFSPLIWRYAVVAEVFTLNNLFLSSLLYILYRFYEQPSRKWILWFAGVFGLACSHHHTILFFMVPIFLTVVFYHHKLIFEAKTFFAALGVWLLGFLPYLYLPFASAPLYIFNWGKAHTWQGFKTHFFRSEYGTFQLASGDKDYSNFLFSLGQYAKDTLDQYLIVGVIPILIALFVIIRDWKKQSQFVKTLVISATFYLLVFHVLANMDLSNRLFYDIQSRFWMAPNIVASLLMGYGILYLVRRGQEQFPKMLWGQALAVGCIGLIGLQVGLHYKVEDYSKNTVFEKVGRSMLDSLPQNAILFLRGDIYVNAVRYLQEVEGYRKDVAALPFDLLWWPWMKANVEKSLPQVTLPGDVYRYQKRQYGQFHLKDLLDANIGHAEIFIGKLRSDEMQIISKDYELWNMGFLNKVERKDKPFNFKEYMSEAKAFEDYMPPKKTEIRDKSWEAFVYYNYWDRELDRGRQIFEEAARRGNDLELIKYGANIMKKIIENHPNPPLIVYKNLGVAYQFMGKVEPQYNTLMVQAWKEYLKRNPVNDPDLNNIKILISAWEKKYQEILNRQTSSVEEKKKAE
ncbi:MAG: DUF2723 domain-containing protein, partial [Bdellovibrionales bacterium]|nr:DUF2723 domain-containing protein [Bdellovibrionales bacterium]